MQGFVVWSESVPPSVLPEGYWTGQRWLQINRRKMRVEKAGTVFQIGDYVRPVHAKAPLIGYAPYGRVNIHESALAEVTYSHPNGNLMVKLVMSEFGLIRDDLGELQTSNEDWERVNATDMEYFRLRRYAG